MMEYKPCQCCGRASLIGIDNICDECWEIKTRIQFIALPLLVKMIREEWTIERTKEFVELLKKEAV